MRIDLPGGDPGYYYDPRVTAGMHGEIRLSPRVERHCRCGGRPPYQVFQRPDAEPVWCPCRRYRLKTQEINRLIGNSGIPDPFRYKFLDDFYEGYDGKPIEGADRLKQISPVAWQHINFFGRYEFRKSPEVIDFDSIVRELSQVPISSTEAV